MEADPVTDAPVVRVELFEDRAAVVRTIASVAAGRQVLRVGPVSPLVRARAVSFPGSTDLVVEDVTVTREVRRRRDADPDDLQALEAEWRTVHDRALAAADATQRATERSQRASAAVEAAHGLAPRAFVESDDLGAWVQTLRQLHTAHRDARADALSTQRDAKKIHRELTAVRARLDAARQGRPTAQAWLGVHVVAAQPGPITLRYVVPCAVWRPMHRAQLASVNRGAADDTVDWELRAMCWNATGEDWTGVQLVCSTARPGDHANPPDLMDDRVHTQRRDAQVVVDVRDEAVHVARESDSRAAGSVLGVDDGGEPRTFLCPAPVDLPSDGLPVQVPLDAWSSPATVAWQALPERSSQVVCRTTQVNAGTRPLLAGPVELVRDGEAVGRSQVALVPPNEPFSMGWGSHDGLRIVRRREHEVEHARVTGRQTHTFTVTVRVSHTGDTPVTVQLDERVPVSELKQVSIDGPRSKPPLTQRPDADGRCRWVITLQPATTRTLELSYSVEASASVTLPFR